jgi:hypothetical protein
LPRCLVGCSASGLALGFSACVEVQWSELASEGCLNSLKAFCWDKQEWTGQSEQKPLSSVMTLSLTHSLPPSYSRCLSKLNQDTCEIRKKKREREAKPPLSKSVSEERNSLVKHHIQRLGKGRPRETERPRYGKIDTREGGGRKSGQWRQGRYDGPN